MNYLVGFVVGGESHVHRVAGDELCKQHWLCCGTCGGLWPALAALLNLESHFQRLQLTRNQGLPPSLLRSYSKLGIMVLECEDQKS